jgi:DNA-directed RNA polymerase subunit RPC12/RpoP
MAICISCGRYVDAMAGDDALYLCEGCFYKELAKRQRKRGNVQQQPIDDTIDSLLG